MELTKNILIIEDDSMFAEILTKNLSEEGINVLGIANNIVDAVSIMKKQSVDLLLIDIHLGRPEDGIAIADELLKMKWIPIIYITGKDIKLEHRIKRTYPVALLEKPVRPRELGIQINLALHNFRERNMPFHHPTYSELIFLPSDQGFIGIKSKEILYVEAAGNGAKVYLTSPEYARLFPSYTYKYVEVKVGKGTIRDKLNPLLFDFSRTISMNLSQIAKIKHGTIYFENENLYVHIPEGDKGRILNQLNLLRNK